MTRFTTKKRMFFIFFNRKKVVHVDFQPINNAAKSFDYKEQLNTVIGVLGGDTANVVIHDDNARIHTSKEMKTYYRQNNLSRLTHSRFSPDLAPNDFWLIRKLKRALDNEKYIDDIVELYTKVCEILRNIPPEEFERCYNEWQVRMRMCIAAGGNYFEFKKRNLKRNRN